MQYFASLVELPKPFRQINQFPIAFSNSRLSDLGVSKDRLDSKLASLNSSPTLDSLSSLVESSNVTSFAY
jgi:hypothetical protein